MRCTRVGWARGSPRRPSVSGRAVSAGSGGSITAGWRVCATRICGPVRWTWASGAGAGLRSRWFRVWPWSWSVGRRISPVRDWLRRRWGITVGWRACSSRGWNLMGSCRWTVRMARMCWGSWPGCVHAGRSRRCGTPRRTCARCSDGSGGMTWRTRSAWPAYAGLCFVKLGSAFCAVFFRSVGSGFSAGCAVSAAACLRCVVVVLLVYLVMRACSLL